jgi:hypothetical protein
MSQIIDVIWIIEFLIYSNNVLNEIVENASIVMWLVNEMH